MPFLAPAAVDWPGTVLAINVGGAVIPIMLSFYLLVRYELWTLGVIAVGIVAFFVHQMATPVPGLGIAVPTFAPPLLAAFVGFALSRRFAAPLAYIGGSLGVLVGADLLNLGLLRKPRGPCRLDRRRGHIRRRFPDRSDRGGARKPRQRLTEPKFRPAYKCLVNHKAPFCVYYATCLGEEPTKTARTGGLRAPATL